MNQKKIQKFRIPEFTFAISPIAIFGDVKVENDMSPYRGPFFLDKTPDENKIKFSLLSLTNNILNVCLHLWEIYMASE